MFDSAKSEFFTQNRELSWLKFDDRVLEEATDPTVPLLERLKFISIFSSNLDEFFMIRVGSLFDLNTLNAQSIDNKSGMTPIEQLKCIYTAVRPLYQKRDSIYASVESQLRVQGVYELSYSELEDDEKKYIKNYFQHSIQPILSPQIIDSLHPFPHLQNNALYIAALLKNKGREVSALVPVPSSMPSVVYLPGNEVRFIRTEKIIFEFFHKIFENHEIYESAIIRVTRNADLNFDDENFDVDSDFRKKMKKILTSRKRLQAVRLEVSNQISVKFQNYLCQKLGLENHQVFLTLCPMTLNYSFGLSSKVSENKVKILTYKPFSPQPSREVNPRESMLKQVKRKDIVLSYPFESISPFLKLIKEAAYDENVVSIKITIYRLANKTKLVDYLCAAAENGKDVTVLIELRARFDEQNNIDWSEKLEDSGCNIIYGFESYKVHSKLCLITMRDKNEFKYITQIGTGNYNEKTAALYTDLTLMTYNQNIGKDANEFFKNMGISNLNGSYDHLLVAPVSLKSKVLAMIDEQIALADRGRIFIKCNSITDIDIMEKLKQASCSGVKVVMVVRGICCILPGIKGKTENISLYSVVGRYLEHSRIYCFGSEENTKMYISSADFMTRNTQRRVEVACPIYDKNVRDRINFIINTILNDNIKARRLLENGEFVKIGDTPPLIDSQQVLMNDAIENIGVATEPTKETNKEKYGFLTRLFFRKKAT